MVEDQVRSEQVQVIGGLDTHADTHTVAAIDTLGRYLGCTVVPATAAGSGQALAWLSGHGQLSCVGIEGTGSYGAGIARYLAAAQVPVLEVNRPNRQARRARGKSDPVDAQEAARAVLAGTATATPKAGTGPVESLRALRVAKRGATKALVAARNSLRQLVFTAPDALRADLVHLHGNTLVHVCARLRPNRAQLGDPTQGMKISLQRIARRAVMLIEEVNAIKADLAALVAQIAPGLLAHVGVGPDTASQLLVTAGDNPDRLHSDAAFAALCGASPIPASSGRTDRHRLNRGGDRHGNEALWRIIITRLANDERTQAYMARRTAQGLTKPEVIRCLKRYLARELLPSIQDALNPIPSTHTLPDAA